MRQDHICFSYVSRSKKYNLLSDKMVFILGINILALLHRVTIDYGEVRYVLLDIHNQSGANSDFHK